MPSLEPTGGNWSRRQWLPDLRKLGWFVVDPDELVS
jgi:hypothetical protein